MNRKKFFILVLSLFFFELNINAQFTYGTTGLLNMPTADMQRDKTFMFGGGFLEKHTTPKRWTYDTYNYYINLTFFPWLEIAYTCTLHKALYYDPAYGYGFWVPYTYGKFVNQDRNFSIRLRLWKEGWWKDWTPQIVIGGNDCIGGSAYGGSLNMATGSGNNFYSRYYIAATKHIKWQGEWGIHLAYVYNKLTINPLNGPCLGFNYRPKFHPSLNIMAEYDSETFNIGANYSILKDLINVSCELNECKYPSIGVYMLVHLK